MDVPIVMTKHDVLTKHLKHFNRVTNKKKCRLSNEMKHHINTNKKKIDKISVAAKIIYWL